MKPTRYIDILTDFGLKFIFGSEPNKDLLVHFLNEVFKGQKHIKDIQYFKTEFPGSAEHEGGVIFDLLCTGDNNEKFLLEVQRAKQEYFTQRSVSYIARLISDQIPKGKRDEWQYDIKEVYFIAILETFSMAPDSDDKLYLRSANIRYCETNEVFYDGLKFIFIELCNFAKDSTELNSDLDNWLYVLKNMSKLDKIPLFLRKPVFQKLFQISEYSKLQKDERVMYDISMRHKWDYDNTLNYARKEARREGLEEGREEGREEGKKEGREEGREEGKKEGREEGKKEGKKEGRKEITKEFIRKLILETQMTDNQIAKLVGAQEAIVKDIRGKISKTNE